MKILSGVKVSSSIREKLKEEVSQFSQKPCLAVILVGDNPASHVYVRNKQKACAEVGFDSLKMELPSDISQSRLVEEIKKLNENQGVHGILLQLPLPNHINEFEVINFIDPKKDVDCLTTYNSGLFYMGQSRVQPCTPWGVIQILDYYDFKLEGAEVLVIGRSHIVGRPVSLMLQKKNATVTMAHSKTKNLEELCSKFPFVIVAAGKPKFLGKSALKKDAVVIDVGIHKVGVAESGRAKLVGDVDFEDVKEHVSAITPVPGGVGPMTITMLLENTKQCYLDLVGNLR